MPKVTLLTLHEVKDALERYRREVEGTGMAPATKRTYLTHSENFVRWLADDFTPGGSIGRRR